MYRLYSRDMLNLGLCYLHVPGPHGCSPLPCREQVSATCTAHSVARDLSSRSTIVATFPLDSKAL